MATTLLGLVIEITFVVNHCGTEQLASVFSVHFSIFGFSILVVSGLW
jgi:hypothetical protein